MCIATDGIDADPQDGSFQDVLRNNNHAQRNYHQPWHTVERLIADKCKREIRVENRPVVTEKSCDTTYGG